MKYICTWDNNKIEVWREDNIWRWYFLQDNGEARDRYDQGFHFGKIATVKRVLREQFYPPKTAQFKRVELS